MEREIRRRLQLKASNDLAIECRRRQKEKDLEEEEAWKAKMLVEMEKVINHFIIIYLLYPTLLFLHVKGRHRKTSF